jgi:RNA polymerase sigma factor for flagellar operon FliA
MSVKQELQEVNTGIILKHMNFAVGLSRRFYQQRQAMGIDCEEFRSAAYLGLCHAAQRFDPSRGLSFESYSFLRIRGAMYDLLRRGGWACPEWETDEESAVTSKQRSRRLSRRNLRYRPFSIVELSDLLNCNENLNMCLAPGAQRTEPSQVELVYLNRPDPETVSVRSSIRRALLNIVASLPEKERIVIEQYYFEGKTFDEIGQSLDGVSKSWVSRLHGRALARLRSRLCVQPRGSYEQ